MTISTDVRSKRYDFTLRTKPSSVRAVSYSYPIFVRDEPDWAEFAARLAELGVDHFTLVADSGLPYELISLVHQQVSALGLPCLLLTLDTGERAKTMETALALAYQARTNGGGTHASCFIALGGGLVGNITGLAASLLVRGTRLVHIPTTLLAGTDSVLSCKQGVNGQTSPDLLVKNLVGTFFPPELVLVYPSFWQGLAADEIRSGLCELIKNIVSIHPHRYQEVLALLNQEARYSAQEYLRIFEWCFQAKQEVMVDDAHEQGAALVLENGHTVGHALEALAGLPHGQAIGLGLLVSAHLSHARGYLSLEDVGKHYQLLQRNGAPTTLSAEVPIEGLLRLVGCDNKIGYLPPRQGHHAMVLLRKLGQPVTHNGLPLTYVSDAELRAAIADIYET
jgi:2-deoxy-scyllo-inosose synthase